MPNFVPVRECGNGPSSAVRFVAAMRAVLKARGERPPFWQEGFFDHVLRSSESHSAKWEYVRLNPERAGLCARADDWPWQGEIVSLRF